MNILLSPIIAFAAMMALVSVAYLSTRTLSAQGKFLRSGKGRPFACGEDIKGFQPQVSYRGFFVFAMFFTIIHVTALIFATVPKGTVFLATIYLAIVSLGLFILMRREDAR